MPERDLAGELGLSDALRTRNRGLGSLSLVLRIAVATTVSYLLARAVSGSPFPLFAPATTLLVVQASPFSTLGMTAQRVLGTGLGVGAATVYVSLVPVTWWSVFLAILVSLLVARLLPVGIAGQLQIPLATVFVLALGPADLSVDLWRVADVALGALVGVIAVFAAPPRPRLAEATAQLAAYADEVAGLARAMSTEAGSHAVPLPDDTRHAFIGLSRALRLRVAGVRDAMTEAVESVRFNPRARAVGTELDLLDQQMRWLTRLAIQTRSLSGAVDRLYDRAGISPALPPDSLSPLLADLAALIDVVARDGVDDDAHVVDERLERSLHLAVDTAIRHHEVVEALDSIAVIGRIDHLREMVWQGPQPEDEVDAAVENELEEPTPTAVDRVRRILGRD